MSNAWQELSGPILSEILKSFYSKFEFLSEEAGESGIIEPTPSITYSITELMDNDEYRWEDINRITWKALRNCVEVGQFLYWLDPHHQCYRFFPHADPESDPEMKLYSRSLPDGDWAVFLSEDLSFGTFGHAWKETVCVFGEPLIREFENMPQGFLKEIRRK